MRGFPKRLNTKFDYLYIRENFSADKWAPAWRALLSENKNWFFTGKVKNESDGLSDSNHRVEAGKSVDGETEYYQYEYMVDPSSDMVKMGFTEDEINDALKGI